MKIRSKEVKECELEDWTKNTVLELIYTHRGTKWKILVKDYTDTEEVYQYILKQLRKQVKNLYVQEKMKSEA